MNIYFAQCHSWRQVLNCNCGPTFSLYRFIQIHSEKVIIHHLWSEINDKKNCDKNQRKLTSKTIEMFFERSTNPWAFLSDRLPRIEFVSQWKISSCVLLFSKVDSSAYLARTARAFYIFMANFLIIHFFFVFHHLGIHKFYIFVVNITIWNELKLITRLQDDYFIS